MGNRVPREVLQEIQDRLSLVAVVSRFVTLRRQGRQHIGLCPFHAEKSPSFHVDDTKGLYYCFGCQEGGDVFKFVSKMEGRSFPEVVRELAEQAGVTIPEPELSPEEDKKARQREALYKIHEIAARWFESQLDGDVGAPAVAYLQRRGLTEEVARRFRLGFAPEGWSGFVDSLGGDKRAIAMAVSAGLAIEGNKGAPYDRFRERVMFPITNPSGRIIAFGGRSFGDAQPKYLNSPESPLFSKSDALYGLSEARRSIAKEDRVLIVEGYFDVLTLVAHGIENVVATCGTSLTRGHLRLLRRYTRNCVLIYDGDAAGRRAAERSLELFLDEEMWPFYLDLPDGRDPDEAVRAEGTPGFKARMQPSGSLLDQAGIYGVLEKGELKNRMATCRPLLDHLVMERCAEAVRTSMGPTDLIGELAPVLRRLKPSQRGYYANLLSQHAGVRPELVEEQLARLDKLATRPARDEDRPAPVTMRLDLPPEEEVLVQLLVQMGDVVAPKAREWAIVEQMTHDGLKAVAAAAIEAQLVRGRVDPQSLLEGVDGELTKRLAALFMRDLEVAEIDRDRGVEQIFLKIRQRNLALQLKTLQERIARLSRSAGEPEDLARLVRERLELVRENEEIKQRLSRRAA